MRTSSILSIVVTAAAILAAVPAAARSRKGGGSRTPAREPAAALEAALDWLVRNQEADGHWAGVAVRRNKQVKVESPGVTGLALLALMRAGAGQSREKDAARAKSIALGLCRLVSKQAKDGAIGRGYEGHLGYNHAISGLALAEACRDGVLTERSAATAIRRAAQAAVDYSINRHQAPRSGWRYKARQAACLSVTGWFVQQLHAATAAGLNVSGRGFQGAAAFLDTVTEPDGGGRYQSSRSPTPTMTAVAMHCYQLMGWRQTDRKLSGAAGILVRNLPKWEGGGVNFYYWYHGTLALRHHGGEHWKTWWTAVREVLTARQRSGKPAVDGSWDPVGSWCARGGRVYATAMAALCLEMPGMQRLYE